MGRLVEFFLDRPLLIKIIIIAVIGIGIKSAFESKKEAFPEISLNVISIQTIYPGASAKDVEINVTIPIEDELEKVDGIKEVTSVSQESISVISIKADENASPEEFRKLYNDIDNVLSGIDDLPNDLDGKPSLTEFTSSDIPIMEIAYTGSYDKLKDYIDNLEPELKKIKGVASVDVVGLPDREVQILVDSKKSMRSQVDLRMIAGAIKKRNLEGSGGTLESFIGEKKVVSLNKYKNYKDVLNTNIFMSADGYGVKLKNVADVSIVPEEKNLIVRNNGKRGAVLSIKQSGSADLLKTVDRINKFLKNKKVPEGTKMHIMFDQSTFTRDRLGLLISNAFIGFILVTIILLIVFDFKTAFWTAFGIPFTLLGLLIFLKLYGVSLNLISLGGFIIIIGMLVDDAIVVSEEISNNKELGLKPKDAAIKAVKKMWLPIVAAVLTSMMAFSPIFYVGGFPGKFVWAIPLMVIVGLTISLFESFFILPSHLYHGKSHPAEKKKFVIKLENIYRTLLTSVLKFKYIVLLFFVIMLLGSIFTMKNFIKKDPFPQDAAEGFNVKIDLPKGTGKDAAIDKIKKFEDILLSLPKKEVVGISTRVGTQSELSGTDRGTQYNIAVIFVYLTKFSSRNRTAEEIISSINKKIIKLKKIEKFEYNIDLKRLGPPLGKPFEIRIISNNKTKRLEKEKEIRKYLSTVDGIYDVDNDIVEGKDEIDVKIDHNLLSRTGLTVEDILATLRIAFDGQIVTDMINVDKKINFRLRLNKKGRGDKDFINKLPIINARGNIIHLNQLVNLKEGPSQAEYRHVHGKRTVTVFGHTVLKKIEPLEVMKLVDKKFKSTNDVAIEFSGQPVETKAIFADLTGAGVIALIGIFLILALIFNSFTRPFIIMMPLPFIVIGVTIALITHGLPLSMLAAVAIVGLMGVVVNDSIVMVHTILDLKGDSEISHSAIIDGAVSRLRPVLLTTLTTVFGVLPTGYGIGGFDPFLSHMCIAMAYGLLFSSFVIMIIVPIMYNIGMDLSKFKKKFI